MTRTSPDGETANGFTSGIMSSESRLFAPRRGSLVTIIGLDDTDSREHGMCTTYAAHLVAEQLREQENESMNVDTTVGTPMLVRLNPSIKHKTRGNAALSLHTDLALDEAFVIAREVIDDLAQTDDPNTNPGLVVTPDPADWNALAPHDAVLTFARSAVRDHLTIADAERVLDVAGYRSEGWDNGRGRIGALAAIGAWIGRERSSDLFGDWDWTYECISYRERASWGTPREVDFDSVFQAADDGYPAVWDTVDHDEREAVCVPHTPCPVLHGIRGDDPDSCESIAERIESEPVVARETFVTNQGTDAHLRDGEIGSVTDDRSYRMSGVVKSPPETKRGGHVFTTIENGDAMLRCAAFEPTKRFRDHVRSLRVGDRITACGEISGGTLKLEKFAIRELVRTERVTPTCPECDRRMKSAGRGQGYRCRDCETSAEGKVEREIERDLEPGWYEVPPCARRHIAKPLVRGGFDAPTHPER
jgi:tRNA(Ile2)-agmatinylcytidine synthase